MAAHAKVLSRELQEAELDRISRLMRIVPRLELSDRLVQHHLGTRDRIMLHPSARFTRGTHFRHRIEIGSFGETLFYVRMGKRGQCKRYLESCDMTMLNGVPTLFEFRLRED